MGDAKWGRAGVGRRDEVEGVEEFEIFVNDIFDKFDIFERPELRTGPNPPPPTFWERVSRFVNGVRE